MVATATLILIGVLIGVALSALGVVVLMDRRRRRWDLEDRAAALKEYAAPPRAPGLRRQS